MNGVHLGFVLPAYTIHPLGDGALLIHFGNRMNEAVNETVLRIFRRLQNSSSLILDVVPAYSSLAVYYDVLSLKTKAASAFEAAKAMVEPLLNEEGSVEEKEYRHLRIPVCYDEGFALDLAELASAKRVSVDDVVALHAAKPYRIYTIGFLPGFAYMGRVDERIATARKTQPRTSVPKGSVGIAGEQTGVYPLASPGGWNIIGRTPLKLFDATKAEPVLLRPGDCVSFYSITRHEFENYQSRNA